MWHVIFLQPVCLLFVLITFAIHPPHHLPILVTIMYSAPVTDLTDIPSIFTGPQSESRGSGDVDKKLPQE